MHVLAIHPHLSGNIDNPAPVAGLATTHNAPFAGWLEANLPLVLSELRSHRFLFIAGAPRSGLKSPMIN